MILTDQFVQTFLRLTLSSIFALCLVLQTATAEDPSDMSSYNSIALSVRQSQPEFIVLGSYPPDGVQLYLQLARLAVDVPLLLGGPMNHPDVLSAMKDSKQDVYVLDVPDTTRPEFRERFTATYKEPWPGLQSCASAGYDAVTLIIQAVKSVGDRPEEVKSWIAPLPREALQLIRTKHK